MCANKQYTKCQTCDPLTGNIKDITLANCQICDPSTGDISTAADGSPCSIGFCKNGECPCGGNNHIEDTSLNRCESCSDLSTIYLNGSKDKPETCETLCNGKEDQYGRFSHRRYLNTYKHCVLAENSDFCHDQADGTHCTDKGKDGACINGYCALTHILTYQQAVQYCKDRGGLPSVEYLNSLGNFRSGTHIWTTNSVNPGTRVCVFAKSCTPNVQNGCENVSETYGCLAACKDDISPRNLYIEK